MKSRGQCRAQGARPVRASIASTPIDTTNSPDTWWPNSDHAVSSAVWGADGSPRAEAAASSARLGAWSRGHRGVKTCLISSGDTCWAPTSAAGGAEPIDAARKSVTAARPASTSRRRGSTIEPTRRAPSARDGPAHAADGRRDAAVERAIVQRAHYEQRGEEGDLREHHRAVRGADRGARRGDVLEPERDAGQRERGHRDRRQRRERPEPSLRGPRGGAHRDHGGADQSSHPDAGGRLVERARRKEPGGAADAPGGVAGQRPGEAEDEGEPEEEDSPREGSGRRAKRAGGRRRGDGDRDPSEPAETRRRPEDVAHRPARTVGQRRGEGDERGGLGGRGQDGAGPGQRQGANEGAVGAPRESGAQYHESEGRPAERHRLAHEAGRAEPYQRQRDHGSATVARRRRPRG